MGKCCNANTVHNAIQSFSMKFKFWLAVNLKNLFENMLKVIKTTLSIVAAELFARCYLLVTFCSLLFARCSLLFARCSVLFACYFFVQITVKDSCWESQKFGKTLTKLHHRYFSCKHIPFSRWWFSKFSQHAKPFSKLT